MGELNNYAHRTGFYVAPELTASAMDFSGIELVWFVCSWSWCALGQEMRSSIR